jgi:hypothetical protein
MRRLEHLAIEAGHKRNYYIKRALIEFLDRNEHLLDYHPSRTSRFSSVVGISPRSARSPQFEQLIR